MSTSEKHFAVLPTSMETSQPTCVRFVNEKTEYTPWVYLHGSLESSAASQGGWDKFRWLESAPTSEGIHNCVAIITDDIIVSATAFLWNAKFGQGLTKLTGLVVADDDSQSLLYALKQFKAKSDFL
jgi:hypothetical protein